MGFQHFWSCSAPCDQQLASPVNIPVSAAGLHDRLPRHMRGAQAGVCVPTGASYSAAAAATGHSL